MAARVDRRLREPELVLWFVRDDIGSVTLQSMAFGSVVPRASRDVRHVLMLPAAALPRPAQPTAFTSTFLGGYPTRGSFRNLSSCWYYRLIHYYSFLILEELSDTVTLMNTALCSHFHISAK